MRRILLGLLCLWSAGAAIGSPSILLLGDSLSAGYGVPLEQSWASLLQQRLQAEGYPHVLVNGSVSGETTVGGRNRLPQLLEEHAPALVMIELGGNDGLRGLPLTSLRDNLLAMIADARAAKADVLLFEMQIPPNYGQAYTRRFQRTFSSVAEATDTPLVPFLLTEIALDEGAFQDDGIHPTAEAQPLILDAVWPHLKPLLPAPGSGE